MAITLETIARNAACNGTVDLLDAGAGAAKLKIRAGGTVLVTITLSDPAFETAGTGAAGQARAIGGDDINPVSAGNPRTANATATGAADNFQATDSADTLVFSGTAGGPGSGADAILDNASITSGQEVKLNTWTHTQPA